MDASLKEITNLVKEVHPESRKKGTIFDFAICYQVSNFSWCEPNSIRGPDRPIGFFFRTIECNDTESKISDIPFLAKSHKMTL